MSQLVGKSAEERNADSVMLGILTGTKNRNKGEVGRSRHRSGKGQWTKRTARGACSKHCRTSQNDSA